MNQGFNQPPQQGFNQPPQQQGFNQPPTQQGFNQPPQQGFNQPVNPLGQQGFNQPPQQGFNQPPQQGGFNQPPQQGFNQPPQQQYGFNQPPQQHGFNQPPQQHGFNQPPQQQQGFNQPPTQFKQPPQQFNQPPGFNQPPKAANRNVIMSTGVKSPWLNEKLPMMVKRTETVGVVSINSHCFDDFFGLEHHKHVSFPSLEEITVHYTDFYIVGISCRFKKMGQNKQIEGVMNCGYQGHDVKTAHMKLGFAEHIEEVSGSVDNGIHSLVIKTKKQQLVAGVARGNKFNNLLKFGIHTGLAFGGSFNGQFLESIYLYHK